MDKNQSNKQKTEISIIWNDSILFSDVINNNKSFVIGNSGDFIAPIPNQKIIENGILFSPNPIALTNKYSSITINDITIKARLVDYEKPIPKSLFNDLSHTLYIGLSGVMHILLLSSIAFFMPPLGIADASELSKDNLYLIQQYLNASAEREQDAAKENETNAMQVDNSKTNIGNGAGQRAIGEEGTMGNPNSRLSNNRFGIAGLKNNNDPHIAREAAIREASDFGMIGLLNTGAGGDPNAPTAIWGRDDSLGNDPLSARGNMWGADIGEANGIGGLGLSGVGIGGGGRGEGIGLTNNGDFIGHGFNKDGIGNGFDRSRKEHKVKDIKVRVGTTVVNGRLAPEIIQRTVRQQYGKMRFCYESGLRNNPSLQGRVAVRFIIGRDGAVSSVSNSGSDLPDQNVVQCVIRGFYGLSFPEPSGGIVSVIYPIVFSPE